MKAIILDGKKVRDALKQHSIEKLKKFNVKPTLVIFQVGDNSESSTYIRQKVLFGESIGFHVTHVHVVNDKNSEQILIGNIEKCNQDNEVHGIIVQLPLPPYLDKEKVLNTIVSTKDVDGLTKKNRRALEDGKPSIVPATARGIFELLDAYSIEVKEKKVVVVGRSNLVGKPVALLAMLRGAQVTVVHSKTGNPKEIMQSADILIVAAGVKHLVSTDSVSPNQIVIDVGIHVEEKDGIRILTGDVDFESVADIVGAISPVPGGVGPLTVAALYLNLIDMCETQAKLSKK